MGRSEPITALEADFFFFFKPELDRKIPIALLVGEEECTTRLREGGGVQETSLPVESRKSTDVGLICLTPPFLKGTNTCREYCRLKVTC